MINLPDNALLDAAPDPMLVINQSGIIVLVNRQTELCFGYQRSELLGKPVEVLIPERYRSGHMALRAEFHQKPHYRQMGEGQELHGQRKSGGEFPVEISLSPVDVDGEIFVVAAIRDSTAHVTLATGLTGILDRSLNEIFIFDAETWRFIQVNEGARRNLGYDLEELLLMTPVDVKPNIDAEAFERLLSPLRAGKEQITFSTIHQRKNGSTYPVEVHLQQSNLQQGSVFVAIILDITERQRAEAALMASNEALEERVVARTAELATAKVEAEQANSGKSRFLAAASHDLRQPLQSLGLYLSVLERSLGENRQLEVAGKMRGSLDTMGELLDALLDISKLDGGSVVPEIADVRLLPLLERILFDNIQQANDKGLSMQLNAVDQSIHTDPALLARIIENFVTNAIRYTDSGGIQIEATATAGAVTISVVDTGIGIAEDSIERVFEEYYQLENQARDRRKGLGLGLSIVRHIARLLEHKVQVTSTVGKGSTFSVIVPVGHSEGDTSTSISKAGDDTREVNRRTLLLVDDDPSIIDATTMLLEVSGARVISADSAEDALAKIDSGVSPDVLITDYRLPAMHGVELIRTVREKLGHLVPAVLITGDTTTTNVRLDPPLNCEVLKKPIDANKLLEVIRSSPDTL